MIEIDSEASARLNAAISSSLAPYSGMPHSPENLDAAQCELDQVLQRIHIGEFGIFGSKARLAATYEHGYLEAMLTIHF